MTPPLSASLDEILDLPGRGDCVAERSLASAPSLALTPRRPLFLEGEAGAGKTGIAKAPAAAAALSCAGGHLSLQRRRGIDLFKLPGVAETLDWTRALTAPDALELGLA